MRCPKCGYISYDHMDSCLKCKKDISGGVEVAGTTYHAVAPSFLRVPTKDDVEDDDTLLPETDEDGEYEFVDSDLDVLSDDGDEIGFTDEGEDEAGGGIDFQLEADEDITEEADVEGLGFDLNEEEPAAAPVAEAVSMSVPDELSDISDLAPPVRERVSPTDSGNGMELSLDDEVSLDESLDLDGLDLDLGLGDTSSTADTGAQSLSLDDIDLSEDDIGTDGDEFGGLNMDLDLGIDELEEDTGTEKEKSSSGLDGLSLSLD